MRSTISSPIESLPCITCQAPNAEDQRAAGGGRRLHAERVEALADGQLDPLVDRRLPLLAEAAGARSPRGRRRRSPAASPSPRGRSRASATRAAAPPGSAARSAGRRRRRTSRAAAPRPARASASCQSISEAITSIPTSVTVASMIGGMTMTMLPTAAAWRLIWLISAPVCLLVVEGEREPLHVAEEVAAEVEDHVLLGLRAEVVVEHREAVADHDDQEAEQQHRDQDHPHRRVRPEDRLDEPARVSSCRTLLRITASGHGSARPNARRGR